MPSVYVTDRIIIPLATWLYLPALFISVLVIAWTKRFNINMRIPQISTRLVVVDPETAVLPMMSRLSSTAIDLASIVYMMTWTAMFAMVCTDTKRSSTSKKNLVYLPLLGLLCAVTVVIITARSRLTVMWSTLRWLNVLYWSTLAIVYGVGAVVAAKSDPWESPVESTFRSEERIRDRIVILGLAMMLAGLEAIAIANGG